MKRLIGWILLSVVLLALGAGIGLGISWGILPVKMVNTVPDTLRKVDKDRYRVLIAEDFLVTGDRARAEARLDLLDDKDTLLALSDQIVRSAWKDDGERDALAALQAALTGSVASQSSTSIPSPDRSPVPPTTSEAFPSLTPGFPSTLTPAKSQTPLMATSPSTFIVINRAPVCDAPQTPPVLRVNVFDPTGKPLNGITLIIRSTNGSERIITGLKPEAGAGGADILLSEGTTYTITIENRPGSSEMLTTAQCTSSSGVSFPGGWKLQIQY